MDRSMRAFAVALPLALALLAQGSRGGGGAMGNVGSSGLYGAGVGRGAGAAADFYRNSPTGGERGGDPKVGEGGKSDVPAGTWGGDGVRLEVGERGAEVEFDCAHGSMGKISPGRNGRFEVRGVFVRERGGPERIGGEPEGEPARYSGRVEGERMTLRVTLTDSNTDAGTFTLTRGKAGRLRKCL